MSLPSNNNHEKEIKYATRKNRMDRKKSKILHYGTVLTLFMDNKWWFSKRRKLAWFIYVQQSVWRHVVLNHQRENRGREFSSKLDNCTVTYPPAKQFTLFRGREYSHCTAYHFQAGTFTVNKVDKFVAALVERVKTGRSPCKIYNPAVVWAPWSFQDDGIHLPLTVL